jgi:CubicO group peptidase (beta-lactamase class C family)
VWLSTAGGGVSRLHVRLDDRTQYYGCGPYRENPQGFQVCCHNKPGFRSVGSYSWAGIYNTHFWVDPDTGVAGVVLVQVLPFYDGNCIGVLRGCKEWVYQALR